MPMQHQFLIGVSGYTAFPRISDPTPVRLLPPPVDPKRFIRRRKRKAFASWDEKVRLMQAGSVVEKFPLPSGYVRVKNYGIPQAEPLPNPNPCAYHSYDLGNGVMVIDPPSGYEYTYAVKRATLSMFDYAGDKIHERKTGKHQGRWIDGAFNFNAAAGPPIQKIGNYRRIPCEGELKVTNPWHVLREERPTLRWVHEADITGFKPDAPIGCIDDPHMQVSNAKIAKIWPRVSGPRLSDREDEEE